MQPFILLMLVITEQEQNYRMLVKQYIVSVSCKYIGPQLLVVVLLGII